LGIGAADPAGRAARAGEGLAQRVLEDGVAALVAGGVDVRDVVGGDIQHLLVRTESGDAGEQGPQHENSLGVWGAVEFRVVRGSVPAARRWFVRAARTPRAPGSPPARR